MESPGHALLHAAEELLQARLIAQALTAFDAAETASADADRCASGRWLAHMLRGDFASAWRESDAIRIRGATDPHRMWMGEPINGQRVILRCLHGFGDSVQMLRYAPMLRERASKLIVEVAPEFTELARLFRGVDEVITWGERAPCVPPGWDVQIEVAELPYLFRTRIEELPLAAKYLELPHAKTSPCVGLRVGLVWASGTWNPSRSVPLHLLQSLLDTPGIEFWNLQGGEAVHEAASLRAPNLHTDPRCARSLLHLAKSIADMDLILTPDTLAAHLAGALARPAWVMLQHTADWRWMIEREDTPWYPSLRLFRQPAEGDWQSVIANLQAELRSIHMQQQRSPWVLPT